MKNDESSNTKADTNKVAEVSPLTKNGQGVTKDSGHAVNQPSTLTYFSTKKSPFFTEAKSFLQVGDFEAALSKIEEGLTTLLTIVPESNELHSALGPLYYLYGTTLLYSIEESQENPEDSVMAAQAEDGNGAGDLQISWENLETARNILSKMTDCKGEQEEERLLDLAQIYCRLGDLSRHNGQYQQAIADYEDCCERRRSCLVDDKLWDRRIADVEYSLGMTCLLLASDGEKNLLNENDEPDSKSEMPSGVASIAAPPSIGVNEDEKKVNLTAEEITVLREKSVRHYIQCGRILGGIIGCMCSSDPHEIGAIDSSLDNDPNKKCAAKEGNGTAKAEGEDLALSSIHEKASISLGIIRQRVAKLKPSETESKEKLHDLREMLDEIQETVDTCEKDREGLRDVNIMRKKAEEDIKKSDKQTSTPQDKSESVDPSAATTTVGFASSNITGNGFANISGSAGMDPNTKTGGDKDLVPMMVVKKKKKRPLAATGSTTDESEKRAKKE